MKVHEDVLKQKFLAEFEVEKFFDSHLGLAKVQDLDPGAWDVWLSS